MYDQYFTGFLHRVEDRLFIQWYQGTKIDNLQFPAFFFVKKLGYVEAKMKSEFDAVCERAGILASVRNGEYLLKKEPQVIQTDIEILK